MSGFFGLLPLDEVSVDGPSCEHDAQHPETGCWIVADSRLGCTANSILDAYLQSEDSFLDSLDGEFAFALWDPRQKKLFCARDGVGAKPFYYYHAPGRLFAFASRARSLVANPEVPFALNQVRIADYLVPHLQWIDFTSTFFEGVYRLPPGHALVLTPDRFDVREYWQPTPGRSPGVRSDEEWREGFVDVLKQAIDVRLGTSSMETGSMLSGGVDSGTVTALASETLTSRGMGPLSTYSAVQRNSVACTETSAIRKAANMPGIEPVFVYADDIASDFESFLTGYDEPFDGEFAMLRALYHAAAKNNRRIVLDGGGGDILLAEGSFITRLLRAGKVRRAIAEIRGLKQSYGDASIARHLRAAFVPEALKAIARPPQRASLRSSYLRHSMISPEFARLSRVRERMRTYDDLFHGRWYADYAIERCASILPNNTAGLERYARLAANEGVESHDPFLDRRVIEYCAHLPGHLRIRDGWPKAILRDTMAGRLPREVLFQRGNPHLGTEFRAVLTRTAVQQDWMPLEDLKVALNPYVDAGTVTAAWHDFTAGNYAEKLHKLTILAAWLRENATRPVVKKALFR